MGLLRRAIRFNPLQYGWRPLLLALALFVTGSALTLYVYNLRSERARELAALEFSQHFNVLEQAIQTQFDHPLFGLRGAMGARASLGQTGWTQHSFAAYVTTRDLPHEFPGIRGFGYIEPVARDRLTQFEEQRRADEAPHYRVQTQGDAPDRYVVKYIEPLATNSVALGLDIASDATLREAVERSIESGAPALSGKVGLLQDDKRGPGFLYLLPAFRDGVPPPTPKARREQLEGFYFVPMVASELLQGTRVVTEDEMDYELLDGAQPTGDNLVYSSLVQDATRIATHAATAFERTSLFHESRAIVVGARLLMLRAGSSKLFDSRIDYGTPRLLAAGGVALSALMAVSLWLLLVGRTRARTLAQRMTQDLQRAVELEQLANRKLTQAMRESQTLMDAIDQHSIVSITDPAGTITYVNDMFCEVSGYSRAELIGQNHRIVKSSVQPDAFWASMWKTISSGYVWRGVVCNRAKNGSLYWLDSVVSPFVDDTGIEKYISIRTNITAQMQTQEQLSEQLRFVEVLLEATPTAIYIKDRAGRYLRFNKAFERLFGILRADWIGKTVFDLVPGETAQMMHAKDQELFQSGLSQTYEASFTQRTTGVVHEGLYHKAALSNSDGIITGLVGTILDVTERNQVARELQIAKDQAEAATQAKGQFLANMSHEIRTPMNAILGMLKLLQSTEMTKQQIDYTQKTQGAARSLLGLLNDILDFSKMDAGKMQLDPHAFQVDGLLRDLAVILSANVGSKPIEVLFDIDPELPRELIGDAMRLQQVLINLTGNAIKFTSHGEVVLRMAVAARGDQTVTVRIEVRDSGIGIAPEHQQHIFDGFSQAEASTTRKFGGTGLGLSISKRLVQLMGGELALQSSPGVGSTFYFSLVLPLPAAAAEIPAIQASPRLGPLEVLVVDDNPTALGLLAAMAQSWGWHVEQAGSGAQALELAQARATAGRKGHDAIFIDWEMPVMDGWQTLARLHELAIPADQSVTIMITGHGRESLAQRSTTELTLLHGFLVKPVTASMLYDAVADAREGHPNVRTRLRPPEQRMRRLEGMRILVAEDNPINQQVARELLTLEGAVVTIADNGALAVEAVARSASAFDAVLMDIQMPVMDGYAAAHAIRHNLGRTQLPIIAMTANAMESDRQACLQAGMNEHIGKPFDLPALTSLLQRLTQGNKHNAPAPSSTIETANAAPATPVSAGQEGNAAGVDAALERMGGNAALYARVVRNYIGEIEGAPQQLETLLRQPDLTSALRLLHTLKGLSATVGAAELSGVARLAEEATRQALKNPGSALDIDTLCRELRQTVASTQVQMQAVAERFEAGAPAPGASPLADSAAHALAADLRTALLALRDLLKNSDMQALEAHSNLHKQHGSTLEGALHKLDEAIGQFNFALAANECDLLLQGLGDLP